MFCPYTRVNSQCHQWERHSVEYKLRHKETAGVGSSWLPCEVLPRFCLKPNRFQLKANANSIMSSQTPTVTSSGALGPNWTYNLTNSTVNTFFNLSTTLLLPALAHPSPCPTLSILGSSIFNKMTPWCLSSSPLFITLHLPLPSSSHSPTARPPTSPRASETHSDSPTLHHQRRERI